MIVTMIKEENAICPRKENLGRENKRNRNNYAAKSAATAVFIMPAIAVVMVATAVIMLAAIAIGA
jgi:hypothetical protein